MEVKRWIGIISILFICSAVVSGCNKGGNNNPGGTGASQITGYAPVAGEDASINKGVDWPNPRFTDNRNGTITDNLTGLIWLQNANCTFGGQ